MSKEDLLQLPKEKLVELIEIYSKNWLALDGVWFQSIEDKLGMDEAMYHDYQAWERFTVIEAKRIKAFLGLAEHPGTAGLETALKFRFYGNLNRCTFERDEHTLVYRVLACRVQTARERKGMCYHPCKMVGIVEYTKFAQEIDSRFRCKCLSCYPDVTDSGVCCSWRFTIDHSDCEKNYGNCRN